jgi:hypothetical protein
MSTGGLRLFRDDPSAPPSARLLSPEELERWSKTTRLFDAVFPALFNAQGASDRERYQRSTLVLRLVEQLFRRERGRPPTTVGELVGPDLPALPDGYDPGDAPVGAAEDKGIAPGSSRKSS